jgi:hypothetical protein
MRIPDDMRKCAVFVAMKDDRGQHKFTGTAFCYQLRPTEDRGYGYLVTARHVIDGTCRNGADGKIYLRVNRRSGGSEYIETKPTDWLFDADDETVDVCVFPLDGRPFGSDPELFFLDSRASVTEQMVRLEGIGPGDDTFAIGLFAQHAGKGRNIPIVRVGNIAAMPEEKVASKTMDIDAYLVEVRSLRGLSGSPVFVSLGPVRQSFYERAMGEINFGYKFVFLGLVHGHWDITRTQTDAYLLDAADGETINQGIAMVVPADKITQLLERPELADLRRKHDERVSNAGGSAEG